MDSLLSFFFYLIKNLLQNVGITGAIKTPNVGGKCGGLRAKRRKRRSLPFYWFAQRVGKVVKVYFNVFID